jgi:hypothetical protein
MTHEKIFLQGDRTKDKAIRIARYFIAKGVDPAIIAVTDFENMNCFWLDETGTFKIARNPIRDYVEKNI